MQKCQSKSNIKGSPDYSTARRACVSLHIMVSTLSNLSYLLFIIYNLQKRNVYCIYEVYEEILVYMYYVRIFINYTYINPICKKESLGMHIVGTHCKYIFIWIILYYVVCTIHVFHIFTRYAILVIFSIYYVDIQRPAFDVTKYTSDRMIKRLNQKNKIKSN